MSHRQPRLKDQATLLRAALAARGLPLGQGETLELVSRLNGYASWNLAKKDEAKRPARVNTRLKFQLWTAVHHHRHGEDLFFFTHLPSDDEIIAAIEERSSWEPDDDESFEVRGVDTFDIDVPLEMAKQAARDKPAPLTGIHEVFMPDLVEYDTPEQVPAWRWVQDRASFSHRGNGNEPGVWEFLVHASKFTDEPDDVPELLRQEARKAIDRGAAWVMFHQG